MAEIKVVFFDIGGVLLTNGWDRTSRHVAAEAFNLEWEDFQERHESVSNDFEIGNLSISEYLQRTVLYRKRDFTESDFVDFMKSRSAPIPGSLAVASDLASTGQYLLATLNNESRELNDYRIKSFGLQDSFSVFLSSSYLGVSKPHKEIYRIAIDITQHRPDECVFIDDRELNLECANLAGIRPIHFTNADNLRTSLRDLGVAL